MSIKKTFEKITSSDTIQEKKWRNSKILEIET